MKLEISSDEKDNKDRERDFDGDREKNLELTRDDDRNETRDGGDGGEDESGLFLKKENNLLDELDDTAGYNWTVFLFVVLCSLQCLIMGINLQFFSIHYTTFQNHFKLSTTLTSLANGLLFIALGAGSIIGGLVGQKINRVYFIIGASSGIVLFTILMGAIDNFISFVIFRFLVGICLGFNLPLILCILTEYLPTYLRSLTLAYIWFGFTFGTMFLILVSYGFTPNLEPENILKVVLTMIAPSLLMVILFAVFLRDSPRNLILHGKFDEAHKITENRIGRRLLPADRKLIESQVVHNANEIYTEGFISLFHPKLLLTTLMLAYIWVTCATVAYGPQVIFVSTLKKLELKNFSPNVLLQALAVSGMSLIGHALSGVLSEFKFFGRKYAISTGFVFYGTLLLLCTAFSKFFDVIFSFASIFTSIYYATTENYTCEFYPTKIRDIAIGFHSLLSRIVIFAVSFISIELEKKSMFLPYYVYGIMALIGALVAFFLPYETYKIHLDIDVKEMKKEQEEMEKKN